MAPWLFVPLSWSAMATRHRVLLVEDDALTRDHLARMIAGLPELQLVAAVASCGEARARLAAEPPEVLLTDLGLPDGSGTDLIRELCERAPDALAMVITVFGDERNVIAAIEAGASGYLLKDGSSDDVARSLRDLLAGGSPISPAIARHLLRRLQAPTAARGERRDPPPGGSSAALSKREREVLELIAKGFSFPEIADLLGISGHTVTTHVRHMYKKLAVTSRAEAVFEALSLGIIDVARS
jgi:DNA-binding NarL/FixJ family response regulator